MPTQADGTTSQPIDSAIAHRLAGARAISRLRDWKLDPRIQSTTRHAQRHRLGRVQRSRTAGGTSRRGCSRNPRPRSQRITRVTIISWRRLAGRRRHADARGGPALAIDGQPLVDPAAHEQLEGQGPAQLLDLARRRGLAGRGVPARRLVRSPGVGQGVGELAPQRVLRLGADGQLQRPAVERGRAVERQGLGRLARGLDVVVAGLGRLLGGVEVDRQRLGVGPPGGLQLAGQPLVPVLQPFGTPGD